MATGIDVVDAEADRIIRTVDLNIQGGTLPVFFQCWTFVIQVNRERNEQSFETIYRILMYHENALNDPAPRVSYGPSLEALLDRVLPQMFMGVMP